MAMTIRLQRTGTHKAPKYRIVVKDHRAKRDGRFVEILGHYNPSREPAEIELDLEKFQQRLEQGATVSRTVQALARQVGFKG